MIYITGDCHRDFRKFNSKNFPEQKNLTRDDYVIILGDFGIWDNSKEEEYWLNWLNKKPCTFLFIDGNHENFDILNTYPIKEWNGGRIHEIRDNIIHLMRGQVFKINNKTFFTFGGAESHDKDIILNPNDKDFLDKRKRLNKEWIHYRINRVSWWEEELPNDNELKEGIFNLKQHNNQIDYILTHCCGNKLQDEFWPGYPMNALTQYIDDILNHVQYQKHFFGHYHQDKFINEKEIVCYQKIQRIL